MLLIYSLDLFSLNSNIDAKSDAIFVIQSKSVQSDIYLFETINTKQVANTAHVCKWIIGVLQKLGENVCNLESISWQMWTFEVIYCFRMNWRRLS